MAEAAVHSLYWRELAELVTTDPNRHYRQEDRRETHQQEGHPREDHQLEDLLAILPMSHHRHHPIRPERQQSSPQGRKRKRTS